MNTFNLFEEIHNLETTGINNRYRVISLPELPHKLGRSEEGFPIFFVISDDNRSRMHNLNAELLSVEYNIMCNTVEGVKEIDNQKFSIITLRSDNEQLQKMFIEVFFMMLNMLPKKPTNIMIASKVENLLSIFSKLKRQPVHKLQGLWAELLLIEQSKDSATTAKAWHSQPTSKYDFTMGSDKVEVKSTSCENRIHRFSLDQLNPSENSKLLVCSIKVRESGEGENGLCVYDLYDRISKKVADNEVRIHIYDVMIETLGSDFSVAGKCFFDYTEACDSLAFFELHDIPKISKESIPESVSEVRFCVDLSHLTDVRDKVYDRGNSSLFNALY